MSMKNIASAASESKLTNIQEGDAQPNAVDLRVSKIFEIHNGDFVIDEDRKIHRGSTEIFPFEDGYWYLYEGTYEIVMDNEIEVGMSEAGFVITRSTLNRNGCYITSGLYDSGYKGIMAGALHVTSGRMVIKPGTRVAQYLCFDAESIHGYQGSYGTGSEHDVKYNQ